MLRQRPVVAWIADDTGFPKKGALGRCGMPGLRPIGQAGRLRCGGELAGSDLGREPADRLQTLALHASV